MKKSVSGIKAMKGKEKIAMLTCYDYSFAKAMDTTDILLVGDSLGNVVLGFNRTKEVTMQDMLRHVEAVSRGAKNSLIIGDLPFGSYDSEEDALKNSKLLIKAGADAVKPEGNIEIVRFLAKNSINVIGHLGLLPQTAERLGIVGKEEEEAKKIVQQAKDIEKAGAFALVLECIPEKLAEKITEEIKIPTIGIGAGKLVDGQVLVSYDMLGLFPDFVPKFAKKYLNLKEDIKKAAKEFSDDIKEGRFPKD